MTYLVLIAIALTAGVTTTLQGTLNAALRDKLGLIYVLFIVSAIQVVTAAILFGASRLFTGAEKLPALSSVPKPLFIAGFLGIVIIGSFMILFEKLGATLSLSLAISGQLLAAMLMDHYGWLGLPKTSLDWPRVLGVALIVAGVILVKR